MRNKESGKIELNLPKIGLKQINRGKKLYQMGNAEGNDEY